MNRIFAIVCISLIIALTGYSLIQQNAASKARELADDHAYALREAEARLSKAEQLALMARQEADELKKQLDQCGKAVRK
ncbi:MAG: hypothetical protein JST14_10380 [Bacteroidetes bacterium]|nr:hypothetical protein [Bacteroidota bacterium]MBS1977480.1 hypothetical protein [Bacteroidota bacterium]